MTTLRLSPKVLYQEIAGESVLLDLASETYFGLNEVGTRVWQGIEKGLDFDAIAAGIEKEFEVTAERARADIAALVKQLLEAKLLFED